MRLLSLFRLPSKARSDGRSRYSKAIVDSPEVARRIINHRTLFFVDPNGQVLNKYRVERPRGSQKQRRKRRPPAAEPEAAPAPSAAAPEDDPALPHADKPIAPAPPADNAKSYAHAARARDMIEMGSLLQATAEQHAQAINRQKTTVKQLQAKAEAQATALKQLTTTVEEQAALLEEQAAALAQQALLIRQLRDELRACSRPARAVAAPPSDPNRAELDSRSEAPARTEAEESPEVVHKPTASEQEASAVPAPTEDEDGDCDADPDCELQSLINAFGPAASKAKGKANPKAKPTAAAAAAPGKAKSKKGKADAKGQAAPALGKAADEPNSVAKLIVARAAPETALSAGAATDDESEAMCPNCDKHVGTRSEPGVLPCGHRAHKGCMTKLKLKQGSCRRCRSCRPRARSSSAHNQRSSHDQ